MPHLLRARAACHTEGNGTTLAQSNNDQVAVFGLGYVGCVTAACLAQLGYRVIGVDKDTYKIGGIRDRRAPFYEPGLEELIREHVASGRLTATAQAGEALRDADIALLCVGTPSDKSGNLGLEQLARVSAEIAPHLTARSKGIVVAVRSTVFPGTCEEVVARNLGGGAGVTVVANPEFLREGCAVRDFLDPSLVVVGGDDRAAVDRVANLYAPLGVEACKVSLRTAELIKYACNSFHALKITFANEMGALAGQLGIDGREVMQVLCRDTRLNLSPAYLRPGFAFGGSCLPKDLRALVHRAGRCDLKLPLLESILPANEKHLYRGIQEVLDLAARRIGVFGLAFKENTDDLRESPVVVLIEQLIGKGREVRVFDPHIQLDQIYGSNRNFILNAIPHIGKLLQADAEAVVGWAECLVVAQPPGAEFAERLKAAPVAVLDLTGSKLSHPADHALSEPCEPCAASRDS